MQCSVDVSVVVQDLLSRSRVISKFACAFGSEADCEACVQANCQAGFETCAGIVDTDADGESNVCDCDDNDATAYPGAPPTAEGVDNNCDGLIGEDEASPVSA